LNKLITKIDMAMNQQLAERQQPLLVAKALKRQLPALVEKPAQLPLEVKPAQHQLVVKPLPHLLEEKPVRHPREREVKRLRRKAPQLKLLRPPLNNRHRRLYPNKLPAISQKEKYFHIEHCPFPHSF
jgi:hypothetical protein